jgi:arylsulfatase A-like enzyme
VLHIALWFGLLTGFGEVLLLAFRRFVLHRFLFLGLNAAWMAPVTDGLIFLVVGLVLAFAHRLWPVRISPQMASGGLAALAVFALLSMFGPLHRLAGALLALGIGAQVALLLRSRFERFHAVASRTLPILGLLLFIDLTVIRGYRVWSEHHAVAARPAPASRAPNVLLIVLDTVRSLSMSLYGYARTTSPELDRWGQHAVRFEHALSTAPWTLPSHATMFTGRFPHELSAGWRAPLDGTYPTLAEVLESHGYRTAGFVGNLTYCSRETGLDRGFAHYDDYPLDPARFLVSTALGRFLESSHLLPHRAIRRRAAQVNAEFLSWLDRDQSPRPFFVFLNYFDAHAPYEPPGPFDTRFGDSPHRRELTRMRETAPATEWPPEVVQAAKDAYDGGIAYMDEELGRLFRELDRRGLGENTLIIVTSDHGEEFGEHGVFWHGNSLYRASVAVPLLIKLPGPAPAVKQVPGPVSLRDLAATVMAVSLPQASHPFPGRSLERFWNGEPGDQVPDTLLQEVNYDPGLPTRTPVSKGPMRAIVLEGRRLIRSGDGDEELFDFENDADEGDDLSDAPAASSTLEQLHAALRAALAPLETLPPHPQAP